MILPGRGGYCGCDGCIQAGPRYREQVMPRLAACPEFLAFPRDGRPGISFALVVKPKVGWVEVYALASWTNGDGASKFPRHADRV